tara:strand:- start:2429 stop:3130 length:702 start_codon:yes stop_codon:yes gene_type:complete
MNRNEELENYLSISPNKFGIYLFNTKTLKNLYKEELFVDEKSKLLNYDELRKFLDNNIYKIEKLSGKFIDNIFIVIKEQKILNLEIGIKKKNYNILVTNQRLKKLLIEAKDLFRENYHNQEIMHMIINQYFFNSTSYQSFKENFNCDHFSLEIQFRSISKSIINNLNKILENYQIKITKYLDEDYVKNTFNNHMELSEMSHNILRGYNQNEVLFMPKNPKKLAFFEKFFQLFG